MWYKKSLENTSKIMNLTEIKNFPKFGPKNPSKWPYIWSDFYVYTILAYRQENLFLLYRYNLFLKNKINIYLYIVQPYKNKKVFIFYA